MIVEIDTIAFRDLMYGVISLASDSGKAERKFINTLTDLCVWYFEKYGTVVSNEKEKALNNSTSEVGQWLNAHPKF